MKQKQILRFCQDRKSVSYFPQIAKLNQWQCMHNKLVPAVKNHTF